MNLDLSKIKKVFFVGIGGIGISAIARMMLLEGKSVLGSDISESEILDDLRRLGVEIKIGQGVELIPGDIDLVIYSTAIEKYDPVFFAKLKSGKVSALSYPEILGIVTKGKYTIAISGTHGKTTTTAMIAKILMNAGKDPSVIIGSLLPETNSNLVVGKSEYFIVEACEYQRAFLNVHPKILVITNIEEDHLDYYKDLADIQNAFSALAGQTSSAVVYNGKDTNVSILVREHEKKNKIRLVDYSQYLEKIPKLSVPGEHNRMNAAAALAVADVLNIKIPDAGKTLTEFSGTWRRLEKKGKTPKGTIVYDDYAHHPTEIRASLQALRELYPKPSLSKTTASRGKKITVLFQPHLYSRTKALFSDFAKSFEDADSILLLPIFFAREAKDESVSSEKLASAIGSSAKSFSDFESAENFVKTLALGKDDVFVTMGAGEAYKVADKVFKI